MKNFFCVSMPRSGSSWMANFFTWGNALCFHEGCYGIDSLTQLRETFEHTDMPVVGTADTAAMMYAHAIPEYFPNARILVVVRDPAAICKSLQAFGATEEHLSALETLWYGMEWVANHMECKTIQFEELFEQSSMREVWDYLEMPDPFPWRRFEMLRKTNIQDVSRFVFDTEEGAREMISKFQTMIGRLPPRPDTSIRSCPVHKVVH